MTTGIGHSQVCDKQVGHNDVCHKTLELGMHVRCTCNDDKYALHERAHLAAAVPLPPWCQRPQTAPF